MNTETREFLGRMARDWAGIDAVLTEQSGHGPLAAAVAFAPCAMSPTSGLCVCGVFLDPPETCVVDEVGNSRPEWAELLGPSLCPSRSSGATGILSLPTALALSGQSLAVQRIPVRARPLGVLGLAVAKKDAAEESGAGDLLAAMAAFLSPRLRLVASQREQTLLRQELEEQRRLADIGELAGPVAHESNNFLNVVSLQVALMEREVADEVRAQLQVIRRQSAEFQATIREFHALRHQKLPPLVAVDVNAAVRAAVAELRTRPSSLELDLAPHLPPVRAAAIDLKRLLTFLLTSKADETDQGEITVRTELTADKVLVRMHASGGRAAAEQTLPKRAALEWEACTGLVRRMEGKLVEEYTDGARAIVVELNAHAEAQHPG